MTHAFLCSRFGSKSRLRGFTIIELLVVISIVAILVGLILSAVQQAREAARLRLCSQHLKEIGLGLQHYHSAHQQFPAGNIVRDELICDGFPAQEGQNWMISILPFIEEQTLWKQYDDSGLNEDAKNQSVRKAT